MKPKTSIEKGLVVLLLALCALWSLNRLFIEAKPAYAGTFTAASCGRADVNAVINGPTHVAIDGDIIIIPSGSCTWTTGITVASGIGIQIIGAGQVTVAPAPTACPAPGGGTCLQDSLVSGATMISMSPRFGNALSRISGITFVGTHPSTGYGSPLSIVGTCATGGCPNLRLDHVTAPENFAGLGIPDDTFAVIANVFGVADHNLAGDSSGPSGGNGLDFANVSHGNWVGTGGYGDSSWANTDSIGTFNAFFFENNTGINAFWTDTDTAGNPFGGARIVCRFNNITGITGAGYCTGHGTDTTGRTRGIRSWEGYFNTGSCTSSSIGCGSVWPGRSGVGISVNNTFTNSGGGFLKGLANLDAQRRWRADVPWGGCDGSSPWDQNDTNGGGGNTAHVYFSGTLATATNNNPNWTLTVAGTPFTPSQWVSNGSPYSIHDTVANGGAEILSNTANTLIAVVPDTGHGPAFAAGQAFTIQRAFVCMDQPARGGGLLVTGPSNGLNPVLASTGSPGNVAQILDIIYEADDSLPVTASGTISSNTASIIQGRDIQVEAAHQAAQSNPTTPFNGTSGSGHGTLANRPTTCTVGVGYWATNQGSWDMSGGGNQGLLYKCTSTNTWTLFFTPACYPHPLITGSPCAGSSGAPIASLAPGSLTFGSILVGSTSPSQNLTLSNTGTATLNITSIAKGGTNPTDFGQTNTCGSQVFVGGSCTIVVTCTPASAASFSATIVVTDDAAGSPHSSTLSCTGITATAGVSFAPTSLTFTARTVGSSSAPQTVVLTNTGSGNLTVSLVQVTTGNASSFSQTNNCTSVNPSSTCNINITFTPQLAGALASQVCVTDNAPASPQCFNISGTGNTVGNLNFAPSSVIFPNTAVGVPSAGVVIIATNSGGSSIAISGIAIGGINSGDFSQTNTCGLGLAAGGSCQVTAKITPTTTGVRNGNITFTDTAPGSPQTVSLQGTGFTPAPSVGLSINALHFGNQTVGSQSNDQVVVITNTGTASLTISTATKSGANPGDFGFSTTCGASLAVGISCSYSIHFTPTTGGSRAANFNVNTNASTSPDIVTLDGTGVASPPGAQAPQVFGE